MNAIGYIRISVKDQSTYSLDNQQRQIQEYCSKNNLTLLNVFKDDGESSYTFDRPDFNALEAFIKKNKSVQYLVVMELDRFSRNLAEALLKIKELQVKYSIKVLATTDDINTDFTDPNTFLMRAFKFMIAESHLHTIRKKTKDGITQAALSGRHANKAPYGYINARDTEGKPILLIDEEKAMHVRAIFREYIRGNGIEECRRIAREIGYISKGNSAVQRILSNPTYAALIRVNGKHVKAIHPPIVSEPDYWFVQQKLNSKRITSQNSNDVPLRGVLRSPFGQLLTAGRSRNNMGRFYWYYRDKRNKLNFPADRLHRQFAEILNHLSLNEEQVETTKEIILRTLQKIDIDTEADKIRKELKSIDNRISNTERKFLLQPDISQDTYNKVITELRANQGALQTRLVSMVGAEDIYGRYLRIIPQLANVQKAFEQMDLNRKHQFINVMFNHSLYYAVELFRATDLHFAFRHKQMILKEKRLLIVEQPFVKMGETPIRRVNGNRVELSTDFTELETLLNVFVA